MQYFSLYAFHMVFYFLFAATTFLPKYFGDLGMTDGQIGMLMSLPAIAGVLLQPLFGSLSDRLRLKKFLLIGLLAALTVVCLALNELTSFGAMMAGLSVFYILQLPIAPTFTAISLEYTREIHKPYGPIRLTGTLGYQIGALVIGLVLASSLRGLFRFIGLITALSCFFSCFLPSVRGHQHGRSRIRLSSLLGDRHMVILLVMVFIGAITSQFYMSFFSKHLGDIGIGNTGTSIMLIVSVIMEIPFLIFADRLARRVSIWNWMIVGFVLNAVRWLGLALLTNVYLLLLVQIPGVSIMACFEFFPALYVNRRAENALKGSAQTALMIVNFGIAKVVGSLVGGFAAGAFGIPAVFAFNGVMLLVAALLFWRPTRRLIAEEQASG